MVLAQVRLLPAHARLPFMPSTWAFTFSWAAVATTVTYWLNDIRPDGYRVYEYLVLAAISALIGAITIRPARGRPAPAHTDERPQETARKRGDTMTTNTETMTTKGERMQKLDNAWNARD